MDVDTESRPICLYIGNVAGKARHPVSAKFMSRINAW